MKLLQKLLIFPLIVVMGCSASRNLTDDNYSVSKANLVANLNFLASDELEGREATTRGEKLAALFLAAELEKYGLQTLDGSESYLQEIPLKESVVDTTSFLRYISGTDTSILKILDNFFIDSRRSSQLSGNFELVFAGFGITADEFDYNDYRDLDVTGKVVIVLNGEPVSSDPDFFSGDELTEYSESDHKILNAQLRGATGIILAAPDRLLNFWNNFRTFATRPVLSLKEPESDRLPFTIYYAHPNSIAELMKNEVPDFNTIQTRIANGEQMTSFVLSNRIDAELKINTTNKSAYNVIGVIPGNNETLSKEYITIGAHYDHLGERNGVIYNGADDNGSGTVTVLEAARLLAASGLNGRSVLVVFHGAEEKGLLGSRYLSDNHPVMNDIVAMINLDMVGRESTDSIFSVGSAMINPRLKELVEDVNAQSTNFFLNYKFDDPSDPQRIYYRSDHYHYARKGIPVVFFYDYMIEDYHKPTDTVDKINFEKIHKITTLVYHLTKKLSNVSEQLRPSELTESNLTPVLSD